jgi:hypothetical protein
MNTDRSMTNADRWRYFEDDRMDRAREERKRFGIGRFESGKAVALRSKDPTGTDDRRRLSACALSVC